MITLRTASVIDAPDRAVVRALRDGVTWRRTARAAGGRALAPERALVDGDVIEFSGRAVVAGYRRWTVTIDDAGLPALQSAGRRPGSLTLHLSSTGAGMLARVDWQIEGAALTTAAYRRRMLALAELLLGIVTLIAREPLLVVVAGAIIDRRADGEDRVLAARKPGDPSALGRWELPGGKVDQGESEVAALARELREELDIDARVGSRIGHDVPLGDGAVLRTYEVTTRDTPTPTEHDQLQWLTAEELNSVDWLPADQALLPELAGHLRGASVTDDRPDPTPAS